MEQGWGVCVGGGGGGGPIGINSINSLFSPVFSQQPHWSIQGEATGALSLLMNLGDQPLGADGHVEKSRDGKEQMTDNLHRFLVAIKYFIHSLQTAGRRRSGVFAIMALKLCPDYNFPGSLHPNWVLWLKWKFFKLTNALDKSYSAEKGFCC